MKFENDFFKEWVRNDEYYYITDQDQEIILADEKYLEDILIIIDNYRVSKWKFIILLQALCIIVYDNTYNEEDGEPYEYYNNELKKRVIDELNKRIDLLKSVSEMIMPYIKLVVYPQLQYEIE